MRNKKVKQIRKEVYGEYSHKDRKYTVQEYKKKIPNKNAFTVSTTIQNTGLRAEYLRRKKEYKNGTLS
jgi:hypothetical protein